MTIASQILMIVSDQNIHKIMNIDILSDLTGEMMGALLIGDVLRKRLYRNIESFAGAIRFVSPNALKYIKRIFLNRKLGYYIRKWESEKERQGALKAYALMQEQFKELLISLK